MSAYDLARPEIRDLVPYTSPDVPDDFLRLNANESVSNPYADNQSTGGCNRYPELRPASLSAALSSLYGVDANSICPTRGSSEAIDLLVRTFCRAYEDNVIVLPPTFEMYAAYSHMQGADIRTAPLDAERDFAVDWDELNSQCDDNTKLVFLCTPNNPTGNAIPESEIRGFLDRRADRTIVVVDEAYIEFSARESLATSVNDYGNLVVLRTLSKAYALAGARCGALISSADIVGLVSVMASPYAISVPVTEIVLEALREESHDSATSNIADIVRQRERLSGLLSTCAAIEHVWPSDTNFILVRLKNPDAANQCLENHRVLIRQFGDAPPLSGCARITIGTSADTDRLMAALNSVGDLI